MGRRTRYITAVVILVMAAGVTGFLASSNLFVSVGTAAFSPGEGDLNRLKLTAPYGWYCITYEKTLTVANSSELHVAGTGISDCPLFGPLTMLATFYPERGTTQVVLDEPTLVYQNAEKDLEIYVLITKDRSKYDQLDGQ